MWLDPVPQCIAAAILKPVKAEFRQTQRDEIDAVRALMLQSFHASADKPSFDRSLLLWKYYAPGPPWPGSRSYVLADGGQILAHAAIWPIALRLEDGVRTGIGFCDWAASEEHRGIGLLLLKKLTALGSFVLVIGGADITREILPRVGFARWASLPVYARVLRPVRQTLARTERNWKEPLRVGRNIAWSLASLRSAAEWSAEFALPDESTLAFAHRSTGTVNQLEYLKFLLECPSVTFHSIVLRKAGAPQGYAMLSLVGLQARIADLRVGTEQPSDWQAAFAAATRLVHKRTQACEIIAIAAVPGIAQALEANGFRIRDERPLVVLDPAGRMHERPVPQLGMLIDDASFLYVPEFPFLT